MRSFVVALIAVLMLAGTAWAQRRPARAIPSVPPPRDPPPHFTIAPRGGSLQPIGLPLPQHGLRQLPIRGKHQRFGHGGNVYGYGGNVFWWPMPYYVPEPVALATPVYEAPRPVERPLPGWLILEVEPAHAEVFADGYYVGVPGDFGAARGGGVIEPGPHRIDVSAQGFEPATVHLRVTAGQTITYRASLRALPPPEAVPPTTFYLIPGCYLGNIPPQDARLPATCDPSRAVTWKP